MVHILSMAGISSEYLHNLKILGYVNYKKK